MPHAMRQLLTALWAPVTALALSVAAPLAQAGTVTAKVYDSRSQLIGLDDVHVGGLVYDVRFVASQACDEVFGRCDATTAFTFAGRAQAQSASAVLLDLLSLGDFDVPGSQVRLLTPYDADGDDVWFSAAAFDRRAPEQVQFDDRNPQSSLSAHERWAQWSVAEVGAVSAVPEPGSLWMMGTALGALALVARRRRSA